MLLPDLTTLLAVALLVFAAWPASPKENTSGPNRWSIRLLVLLLLSPGLRYLSILFTFPIRLQLSAWAGSLLRLAGLNVQTQGNVLIWHERVGVALEMAVDPACMGLQLTGVSLLVALFLLIRQEKQHQKIVPLGWVAAYGAVAFGLTIICNLFRIVLLVAFRAMPGTWAHELIGLGCVVAYAWLPAWTLAPVMVGQAGVEPTRQPGWSAGWGVALLAGGLGIMAFAARPTTPRPPWSATTNWHQYGLTGSAAYRSKMLPNGFMQLVKRDTLIYLKPQPDWFSADHSPTACWQGSGYELRRVRETVLNGHPAYAGELHRNGTILHTAWWFTNGTTTTTNQLTMRGQMLRGQMGFVLVNITVVPKRRSLSNAPPALPGLTPP